MEASVPLEIVVDDSGTVRAVSVLARVGYGLDEAATRAVLAYRFAPARRAGKPQAVRLRWLVRFHCADSIANGSGRPQFTSAPTRCQDQYAAIAPMAYNAGVRARPSARFGTGKRMIE